MTLHCGESVWSASALLNDIFLVNNNAHDRGPAVSLPEMLRKCFGVLEGLSALDLKLPVHLQALVQVCRIPGCVQQAHASACSGISDRLEETKPQSQLL